MVEWFPINYAEKMANFNLKRKVPVSCTADYPPSSNKMKNAVYKAAGKAFKI